MIMIAYIFVGEESFLEVSEEVGNQESQADDNEIEIDDDINEVSKNQKVITD